MKFNLDDSSENFLNLNPVFNLPCSVAINKSTRLVQLNFSSNVIQRSFSFKDSLDNIILDKESCGVQLLSWEMESVFRVQILNEAVCGSFCVNVLEKGMDPSLPVAKRLGKYKHYSRL